MPQGHQTSPELQWAIVWMVHFLDYERIAMCLNLSVRTIKRVHTYFRTYGTIPNPSKRHGCKLGAGGRHLRDVDVEVCEYNHITQFLLLFIQWIPLVYPGDNQANS